MIPTHREQILGWNICGKDFQNTTPESVQEMAQRAAPLYASRVLCTEVGWNRVVIYRRPDILSENYRAAYFF